MSRAQVARFLQRPVYALIHDSSSARLGWTRSTEEERVKGPTLPEPVILESVGDIVYQALRPGGTIYIKDFSLDESRLSPQASAVFNPVMVAIYKHGKIRIVQEYRDLLVENGFEDCELQLHADPFMTARKPVHAHSTAIHS